MTGLIVICGLPGVGKSTIAEATAARAGATHLSIDAIEEAMLACGLPPGRAVGVAAYEAARAIAELNLRLGRAVVVDAVNDSDAARETWRAAAASTGARLLLVDLVVRDLAEHERRLAGRRRGFQHVQEPSWQQVRARGRDFEPWTEPHLELDAGAHPPAALVDAILAAA